MAYLPRIVDLELAERLAADGLVVVEGPKACGKTETARQKAESEVLLDVDVNAQQAAAIDPTLILSGPEPRLIDEWQVEPGIWNVVRRTVDDSQRKGMFILTGSSVPPDDQTRHSGTGRISRLHMRPMSLSEAGVSSNQISLGDLLDGQATACPDPGVETGDMLEEIVRGGWPGYRGLAIRDVARATRDYIDQLRRTDISTVDGVTRDPERVLRVLRSLARNSAGAVKLTTIAADASDEDARIKPHTVAAYLESLTRLMVIENAPAWQPHLRSTHALRQMPVCHFVDPSLAAAALRASPASLLKDLNTAGLLFESLVVRDLRVYGQRHEATLSHYRDSSDLEVDAVITADDGRWIALEVKLGTKPEFIDAAAANLLAFAKRVDTSRVGEPAMLGIVVGSGYGYVRKDGVHVIPVGALTV